MCDWFDSLSLKRKYVFVIGMIVILGAPIAGLAYYQSIVQVTNEDFKECVLVYNLIQDGCFRHYTFFINETEQVFSTKFEDKCELRIYDFNTEYWCRLDPQRISDEEVFESAVPKSIIVINGVLGFFLIVGIIVTIMLGIRNWCEHCSYESHLAELKDQTENPQKRKNEYDSCVKQFKRMRRNITREMLPDKKYFKENLIT